MFAVKKKGGKSFAPKIRPRGPPPPSSAQSSARPSVEPQSETPASQPETIVIRDSETPDPSNTPSTTTDNAPQRLPLERTQDAPPQIPFIADIATQNVVPHIKDTSFQSNAEGLKRKSRDKDAGIAVDGPQKRHQPRSLDAPRTPPPSSPASQPVATNANFPPVQRSESAQLSTSVASQTPSQTSDPVVNTGHGTAVNAPGITTVQIDGTSQVPQIAITPSAEVPLPKSAPAQPQSSSEAPLISSIASPKRSLPASLPNNNSAQSVTQDSAISTPRRPLPDGGSNVPVSAPAPLGVPAVTLGSAGAGSGLGAAGNLGGSGSGVGQLAQTPVIAQLNPDGTPGEAVRQRAAGQKKKAPKRRTIQDPEDGDNVRPTVEIQLNQPRPRGEKKKRVRKERVKKEGRRAETPSDAEDQVIDVEVMTMADMCKDLRVGKKFSRHAELRQREKDKILKAKMAKNPVLVHTVDDEEDGNGEGTPAAAVTAEAEAEAEAVPTEGDPEVESESQQNLTGIQMKIVDGVIVADQASTQFDRQKAARVQEETLEHVVEDAFTKVVTCGTHMKREKAQLWDMAANETFYKGLRMFGTDFQMIAGLFPHRNRRQIKLKFCKEEKDNPRRIDKVLKGAGSAIEIDTFEKLSGRTLESIAEFEAEHKRIDAENEAKEAAKLAERAEIERQKRETILAKQAGIDGARGILDGVSDDEGGGGKENKPKKLSKQAQNRRKRKQQAAEETVVVLGDA